jgi:hypothetical protein
MGVTPAGAAQTVTQAVWQSWRWAVNHLHWRVLWWWPHWEEGWREQPGAGEQEGEGGRAGPAASKALAVGAGLIGGTQ